MFVFSLVACDQLDGGQLTSLLEGGTGTAVAASVTDVDQETGPPTPTLVPNNVTGESVQQAEPAASAALEASATLPPTATQSPEPTSTATTPPTATQPPEPTPLPVRLETDTATLTLVPGGAFLMGAVQEQLLAECELFRPSCDDAWFAASAPPHTVTLAPFYMDIVEVSNAAYLAFLNTLENPTTDCDAELCLTLEDSRFIRGEDGRFSVDPEFADHPVTGVTWFGADAYCAWRDARLPTEAEWEMAAAWNPETETHSLYPWGDVFDGSAVNTCDANCKQPQADASSDDGATATAPVGSYENGRSPSGLYDMAGNVWEWVHDWYAEDFYAQSPAENPIGPETADTRVVRGGSWFDTGNFTSTVIRFPAPPHESGDAIGFRCAQDAIQAAAVIAEVPESTPAAAEPEATATAEITPSPVTTPVTTPVATPVATPTPAATAVTAAASAPVAVNCNANPGVDHGSTYVVGSCDWLSKIARKLGVSYHDLLAANPQIADPNIIQPGQVLNVPPR